MTTATTPRQPAKRAKGRAHTLTVRYNGWDSTLSQIIDEGEHYLLRADEYDQAVERMARAIARKAHAISKKQTATDMLYFTKNLTADDLAYYAIYARAALKSIGIPSPQ